MPLCAERIIVEALHDWQHSRSVSVARSRKSIGVLVHAFLTPTTMAADTIPIQVEFGGGLELLFSNQRTLKVDVPSRISIKVTGAKGSPDEAASSAEAETQAVNLTYLMYYLRDNLLKDRPELFMSNGTM